jgi:hypothetical protein
LGQKVAENIFRAAGRMIKPIFNRSLTGRKMENINVRTIPPMWRNSLNLLKTSSSGEI